MTDESAAQLWIFIFFVISSKCYAVLEPSGVLAYPTSASERQIVGIPTIKEVSAMCSNIGGIHASIEFDRPFSGRVYSLGYSDTHECVYFNGYHARRLLFSIPIDKCGTHLTRNTRNIVDTLENRVYVQMDKFTLTGFDRKYAFVCELTSSNIDNSRNSGSNSVTLAPVPIIPSTIEIRRHPLNRSAAGSFSSLEIENATPLVPIIPKNAPRGVTPMMPALLYYGNRHWRVPAENVRSSSPDASKSDGNHPTVIVPIEDRAGEIVAPLSPDFTDLEGRGLTFGLDELSRDRISVVPDVDLLQPSLKPLEESQTTTIATTTRVRTTTEEERTTVIQLYFPPQSTPSVVVLPYAQQTRVESASPALNNANSNIRTLMAGSSGASDDVEKSIFLEIKRNGADESPFKGQRVEGSVRIGEPITLVVHAKSASKDTNRFDIFVHSCYSSGGSNLTRIQLIDKQGCTVHPLVIGSLRRARIEPDEIVYYFTMRAFKFPAGDDVHFFCSVDISPDADFSALCTAGNAPSRSSARLSRRWVSADSTQRDTRAVHVSNFTLVSANELMSTFERISGVNNPTAEPMPHDLLFLVGAALLALLLLASVFLVASLCCFARRSAKIQRHR